MFETSRKKIEHKKTKLKMKKRNNFCKPITIAYSLYWQPVRNKRSYFGQCPGCVTRRSIATLEDRSWIPGAGNNNVLVTRSDWHTLLSSVYYASFVSICIRWSRQSRDLNAGATIQPDHSREINITRAFITSTIHSHDGSLYPVNNELDDIGGRVYSLKPM